jgi:hypothetical protein
LDDHGDRINLPGFFGRTDLMRCDGFVGVGSTESLRECWRLKKTWQVHTSPNDNLAELRAALGRLGALLDRDDISDDVYQKANAEYDALFDRVCHAEDDCRSHPM